MDNWVVAELACTSNSSRKWAVSLMSLIGHPIGDDSMNTQQILDTASQGWYIFIQSLSWFEFTWGSKKACWTSFIILVPETTVDLSAACNTIDHGMLLDQTENHFFKSLASCFFKRTHCVSLNNVISMHSGVKNGAPQGSVLNPLLFSLKMLPLGRIIHSCRIHFNCCAVPGCVVISCPLSLI